MKKIKSLFAEFFTLLRNVPALVLALFVISVIMMNILANKSIETSLDWLALDCGIIFSWVTFLVMDIITKRFGPKAATMLSVVALAVNLFIALMLFIASIIPGVWGESFVKGSEGIINTALNNTMGGTWYVLLGSSVAFLASAVINNFMNYAVGKAFKKNGFMQFATRTYVSTFIGQFCDNFIFALIVSHQFFGWTILQCVTCALAGAVVELIFEVIFSPLGYKISRKWAKDDVGGEYIRLYGGEKQ